MAKGAVQENLSKFLLLLPGLILLWTAGAGMAGYKAREWNAKARELYAASLSSEGVTIAAEPLFTDALAARAFDKKDVVTRGIMPLALVIFNDNDYPRWMLNPLVDSARSAIARPRRP